MILNGAALRSHKVAHEPKQLPTSIVENTLLCEPPVLQTKIFFVRKNVGNVRFCYVLCGQNRVFKQSIGSCKGS